MEMTRKIKSLCLNVNFNGKILLKVLLDNGLVVNRMPCRMLGALKKNINDLIFETEVSKSVFTGAVSKNLEILLINIITASKISLSLFLFYHHLNYKL